MLIHSTGRHLCSSVTLTENRATACAPMKSFPAGPAGVVTNRPVSRRDKMRSHVGFDRLLTIGRLTADDSTFGRRDAGSFFTA